MGDCNRILLVELEGIVQKAEMRCLRNCGAEVDVASNGNSALEKAQSNLYDFILVDDYLDNRFNGFKLIQAIKSHSLNKTTQCAILCYDDAFESITKAINLGIWFITRPVLIDDAKNILELAKEFYVHNKPL